MLYDKHLTFRRHTIKWQPLLLVITISPSQAPFVYLYWAEQLPEGRGHTLAPASEQALQAFWWNEWIFCKHFLAFPPRGRDPALPRKVLDAYLINGSHKRGAVIRGFHLNLRTPRNLCVGFLPLIRNSSEAFLRERSGLPPQPDPDIPSMAAAAWQSRVRTYGETAYCPALTTTPAEGSRTSAARPARLPRTGTALPPRSCQRVSVRHLSWWLLCQASQAASQVPSLRLPTQLPQTQW